MEVYERPRSKFAAGFLGEANFLTGRIESMNGGIATIALDAGGRAQCVVANGEVGQMVTLALRPEKISFDGATTGLNQARGRVTDVVFSGNSTTYRVAVGEKSMTLFRQNLSGNPVAPGAEVTLSWSGDHLVAVTP